MRLKGLITIIIVIAVGIGGFFIKDYFASTAQAETLSRQIKTNTNSVTVAANDAKKVDLELRSLAARSNATQSAILDETRTLPEKVNPNTIVKNILTMGNTTEVKIIPLNVQDWTGVKIDKHSYQVFRMKLNVEGLQENIVRFVQQLQDTLYDNLVIENLVLTRPTPTPTPTATETPVGTPVPEATPENENIVKARISLAIYAR